MRCILYARFSTDRQSEASIEDQLRVCREFVAARGWRVASEHADRGISGAALGNRPGVQAALEAATDGDALIVNDLFRLARSQDLAPLITRLRHRGVRVIGVQDGHDSDADTSDMQAGLSGIMSVEYRRNIARRTHSALKMRAIEGRATGGKAFADPEIVKEIFRRFSAGEAMLAIARDLNRRGVPSPGAKWKARARPRGMWLKSALHALLQNECYIGRVIWNRSKWVKHPDTGRRQRRERPQSEWTETACEPLVDRATWDAVQARIGTRPRPGGVHRYLLSGLLVCGVCSGKLIIVGGDQRRYVCGTRREAGPEACSNRLTVPRQVAERYILEPIQRELLSPEAIAEGVKELRKARAAAEVTPAPVDAELAELERLVRAGVLSPEIAAPSIAAARRRAAERRSVPVEGLPWPTPAAYREAIETMSQVLRGDDVTAAREALRGLVGEIRCVPEGEHLVAELTTGGVAVAGVVPAARVLLRTGTGPVYGDGSGGPLLRNLLRIRMPAGGRR